MSNSNEDKYSIGECRNCKNVTVLKNGYCDKCNKAIDENPLWFLNDFSK